MLFWNPFFMNILLFYHQNYLVFKNFICFVLCFPPSSILSEILFVFTEMRHQNMPLPREKTSSVLFSEYFNLEKVAPHFKHGPGRNRVSGGEGEN